MLRMNVLRRVKYFRRVLTKHVFVHVILFAAIVLSGLLFIRVFFHSIGGAKMVGLAPAHSIDLLGSLADDAVARCKGVADLQTCYDNELVKTMDRVSMEDAFKVTQLVQRLDSAYAYCHVLGHKLAAKETAKDPSGWKTVIARCPSGVCSNGCIHGAFQERFRTDSFTSEELMQHRSELDDVCEPRMNWSPTGLEQASCYHALGHLLMYITDADIHKSVELCEQIAGAHARTRDFRQLCFDGAFMQIFQPLENSDFVLIKGKVPTAKDMSKFCSPFKGAQREPCWAESWPLVREQILTPEGLSRFCEDDILSKADRNRCFTGMFYVVTAQFQLDSNRMLNFCKEIAPTYRGRCYANAASRMIETDYVNIEKAVKLCASAVDDASKDECFAELVQYSTYDFKPGAPEQTRLCSLLPAQWRQSCGKQEGS